MPTDDNFQEGLGTVFGYVKIAEDELKVKELKRYKNYYCSLCRQIAYYSQSSRLMLSYDMVFLSLLIEANSPQDDHFCKHRLFRYCKKRCGDLKLKYISAISVILQYYKLQNDVQDGDRYKSFIMGIIYHGFRSAVSDFPVIHASIANSMSSLNKLEASKCSDFTILVNCFAGCFSDIFLFAPIHDEFSVIRAKIAYHIAAWVYLFDMLQDVADDRKTDNFNAILLQENEYDGKVQVLELLNEHIVEAIKLLDLLPYSPNIPILNNIISIGLPLQIRNAQNSES